ncbi:MAG: hypothetical protein R3B70_45220 [Polyangiaceae bacterium]
MSTSRPPPPAPLSATPSAPVPADLAEARAFHAQLDPAWFDEANDPEAWLFEPAVQEIIAGLVEEGVAPYVSSLPPEQLQAMRMELEVALHTDRTTIEYLRRVRPRASQDASGKVRKGMFDRPPGDIATDARTGGKRS